MVDVKSNGRGDGELKLREARLEFRSAANRYSFVGCLQVCLGLGSTHLPLLMEDIGFPLAHTYFAIVLPSFH